MEEVDISLIVGILVTMVFSAFFSGMEIAFVSSNRMLAEMDKEKNGLCQRLLSRFYNHPNGFVSTMLVGNNIALVVYGILFARLFDNTLFAGLDDGGRVTADTILSTLIVLFTGEFLPKTLFKANPNRLLTIFSPIAYLCYVILWPISKFSTFLSKCLLRLVGMKMESEEGDEGFSKVDLDYLVQSSIDNATNDDEINDEVKIFQNALDFSDTKVRDCMVPRTEIQAVEMETSLEELRQKFIESGNSKIIVYEEDIDHIVGYIHSSELFHNPKRWQDHIRTMPFVPETMQAQKLMQTFLQQKKSLGVVVDSSPRSQFVSTSSSLARNSSTSSRGMVLPATYWLMWLLPIFTPRCSAACTKSTCFNPLLFIALRRRSANTDTLISLCLQPGVQFIF